MKKALSLFIALIIIISVFPLSAFAYAGTDLRIDNQGVYPGRTFFRPYPYFMGYNENTLYLNNNVITKGDTIYGNKSGIQYTDENTLYICVSGNNVISATDIGVGINSKASKIHIYGNGTLTINANNTAIESADDIYISGIALNIVGKDGIVCEKGTVTLDNVNFTADCDAAIKANEVIVNDGSLELAGANGIVCEEGTVTLENVDFEADCTVTAIKADTVYFDNSEPNDKSITIKAWKGIEADTVEINDCKVEFQTGTDVGIDDVDKVYVNGGFLKLACTNGIVCKEGTVTLENVDFEADCTVTAIEADTVYFDNSEPNDKSITIKAGKGIEADTVEINDCKVEFQTETDVGIDADNVTIDCSKVNSDAKNTITATKNVEITNSLFKADGENAVIAKNVAITNCVDDLGDALVDDEDRKSAVCIEASKNGINAEEVTINGSEVEFANGEICISATDVTITSCPSVIFDNTKGKGIKASDDVSFNDCYFVFFDTAEGISANKVEMKETLFCISGGTGINANTVTIEECSPVEDENLDQFAYYYISTANIAINASNKIYFKGNELGCIKSENGSALEAPEIIVEGGKLEVEAISATDAINAGNFKVENKAEVIIKSSTKAINEMANLDNYEDCLIDYKESDKLKLYNEKYEAEEENYYESNYVRIYSGENIYGIVFPKDNTDPKDYPNLQDAFEAARDGDVVVVRKDGSAEVSGNKTINVITKNNAKANISSASGYGMVIIDRKDNQITYRFYELPEHRFLPGHDYNTSKTTESTTPVKEEETNPNTGASVAPMALMLAAIIPACIIGKKHF